MAYQANGIAIASSSNGISMEDEPPNDLLLDLICQQVTIVVYLDAGASVSSSRPSISIGVVFETPRTEVHVLYAGILRMLPRVMSILGHCGSV